MNRVRECPVCRKPGLSIFDTEFAYLRRYVKCNNCGARFKTEVPLVRKIIGRLGGPALFWAALYFGLKIHLEILVSIIIGTLLFVIVEHLAERNQELKVLSEKK